MKKIFFILSILLWGGLTSAQNPVCPIGTYFSDPTARVWPDGKLYIYGSTDEALDHWCSYKHDVLFTNDLKHWNRVNDIFASKGPKDSVAGTDALLWAPDAMYRNGKYYLYFCTPDKAYSEGVATSSSPLGPFGEAKKIAVGKYPGIDPTIFVDDDGQAYYYWGQFNLKGAKVNPDMTTIDTSTIHTDIITRKEHFFHEGSFVFKRKGIYYVLFADEERRDHRPTCLGYATGSSPFGPFSYRGIIIDNFGCDPESWNNHGSVAEYQGQWYVFYHRSSQGSQEMRRTCMELIHFNPDGSIPEVEMTSQGAVKPLPANTRIEAERTCFMMGYCRVKPAGKGNEVIGDIKNNDKAAFKYLDFGNGVSTFKVNAEAFNGGTIVLHRDSKDGAVIGRLSIPRMGPQKGFKEYTCSVIRTTGIKALWLEFKGTEEGTRLFDLDAFWFQ